MLKGPNGILFTYCVHLWMCFEVMPTIPCAIKGVLDEWQLSELYKNGKYFITRLRGLCNQDKILESVVQCVLVLAYWLTHTQNYEPTIKVHTFVFLFPKPDQRQLHFLTKAKNFVSHSVDHSADYCTYTMLQSILNLNAKLNQWNWLQGGIFVKVVHSRILQAELYSMSHTIP